MEPSAVPAHKAFRHSRTKAKKKKSTSTGTGGKKVAVAKPGAFARRIRLSADRAEKRAPNPNVPIESINGDAAPRLVAVVGPSGVGKTTVIRNLVRHYSKRKLPSVTGPITLVAGRKKRLTFMEVGADLSSMIDAAKVADLVLLVIDAAYGFEMETFEFLNIAAAHGMPKIIAVLTHLDKLPDGRQVSRAKKTLKDRIWAELYDGAKVFYLSGITTTGDYLSREILNLARFISVAKQANLRWRLDHPYLLADRVEDVTDKSQPAHADRTVALYGYVRGSPVRPMNGQWRVHLCGVSDLVATSLEALPDPCPPPEVGPKEAAQKGSSDGKRVRRRVSERERVVHAPMAPEVDGISYDRDAVYINIASDDIRFSDKKALVSEQNAENGADDPDNAMDEDSSDGEGEKMVKTLQKAAGSAVDESLKQSELQLVTGGKRLKSEQFTETRKRRPANFADDEEGTDSSSSDDSDEGSDSSDDESERKKRSSKSARRSSKPSDGSDSEDSDDESSSDDESGSDDSDDSDEEADDDSDEGDDDDDSGDDEANAQRWKEQMLDNAAKRMKSSISASKALSKLIYDKDADGSYSRKYDLEVDTRLGGNNDSGAEDDEDDEDEIFTRRRKRGGSGRDEDPLLSSIPDGVADDMTKLLPNAVRDWINDESICKRLRRTRWATGYRESVAGNGEDGEKADDDASVDGDFEDLETGDVHHGRDGKKVEDDDGAGSDDGEGSDLEKIRQEKIRKKQQFDSKWDNRGGRKGENSDEDGDGADGGDGPDVRSRKAARGEIERTVDPRRVERDRLDRIRREELDGLDAETLLEVQGLQPGQYVRVELKDVPVEFVQLFDPRNPVILGGLQAKDDEGMSFLRARVRRHRFKRGVLKSSDPVIFSVGWRRFQSMPVYDAEDVGGRRRFLKYTPEFLHCNATFWGPGVSPGVGVVLCQTLGRERAGFRVAGTGVVTELSSTCNVVKKLKLTGEPVRVHKNTAFIKGMFSSETEVSKFIGAGIRTVSGIRGTVKKAISEIAQRNGLDRIVAKSPAGTFRAGFEDRILLSDIVFLRTWVPVEAPRFCSIAANLLERGGGANGGGAWRMRTIREVRQAKGMAIPLDKDSLYKEVERKAPMFAPFKLSRKLEAGLPFASKPKDFAAKKRMELPERKAAVKEERAVVLSAKEKKEQRLLQAVYTIRNDREKRRKETRVQKLAEKKKEWKKAEENRESSAKANKKRKFALDGIREAQSNKRSRGGGDD